MKFLLTVGVYLLLSTSVFAAMTIVGSKHDLTWLAGGDICRYCHAGAHGWLPGGIPGMGRAMTSITKVYSSSSMAHTINKSVVEASDAAFCISCHDGAGITSTSIAHPILATSTSNLTQDLSNDHPVGFVVNMSLKTDLKVPVTARIKFGKNRNEMWCSSCHNVHDKTNFPFLVMDNSGSNLCYDCHIK